MHDEPRFPDPTLIDDCLLSDRHAFRKRLAGLERRVKKNQPLDIGLAKLEQAIGESLFIVGQRRELAREIAFPPDLPVSQRIDEIRETIASNQVVILCGETGSGKSTQLPKICLSIGLGIHGRIGHTQPRRIAARSLMSRISTELDSEPGTLVGYKVRFKDRVRPQTRVKLMTDGILLAEIQRDPWLNEYDTLIIDEAHERSLNIDFLLGYIRQLTERRRDLKVIITSATIDPQRFSRHFNDAPVIEVSGRTYAVDLRYRPLEDEGVSERDEAMQQAIVDAVDELSREDRGDILIFLSGEREIRETAETLRKHRLQVTEVLPLYARLSPPDQAKIFKPSGRRRIVLATNVAETSLTVPGIRHVIDAGFARISRYSHRSKVQRLPVEFISKASADQRKGRCGRVAEGICIRLYSEEQFESRREFTEPEIQRTNLASVILQMKLLRFGDIASFPFIDPPDARLVRDGYRLLEEIGAVDGERKVTRIGRQLARLPVDPRIGRMLLEAAHGSCLKELLVIAAALSVQDPRDRPLDKQQAADEAHKLFHHEQSDFIGFVNLWKHLEEQRHHLTRRKFMRHCRERFLSPTRVQEWHDIHQQLKLQMHELGYRENEPDAGYEEIHMAILSGLLSHIGFRESGSDRDYKGARGSRFYAFPGSSLFEHQPKWIVAAELVETTRLYGRTLAMIQPQWIESMAGHLVKHSYSEPHWQAKRGQVGGYERITLYGLTLVARRRINFGPVDPVLSREIFIRSALVDGDFETRAPFWRHNRELIEALRQQEAKSRSRDILVDEEALNHFYDSHIPEGIYSKTQFEQWLRKATKQQPKLLYLTEQELLRPGAHKVSEEQFPDTLDINGMRLPLEYHFEPGAKDDGVTLVVPVEVLNQVTEERLEWLVPGLLEERITTLLRGLPKSLRRNFVPIPDTAKAVLDRLRPSGDSLLLALGDALKEMTGVHISDTDWPHEELAPHLKMNLRIIDASGSSLATGRDLARLKSKHAGRGEGGKPRGMPSHVIEQEGITRWTFGDLPEQVTMERAGIRLTGFPALVDERTGVAIRIIDSLPNAALEHRKGLRRLIMLSLTQQVKFLRKELPGIDRMRLQMAKAPARGKGRKIDIEEELVSLIIDRTFLHGSADIRKQVDFEAVIDKHKASLMSISSETANLVSGILDAYQRLRKQLSSVTAINWLASVQDMQQQLDGLVYQGFLQETPWEKLQRYPAYLKALELRLDKLRHAAARDQQSLRELAKILDKWKPRYEKMLDQHRYDERLEELRWSIEELRISLFAQEVKTAWPVSMKRLEKRWQELGL
jgi:ATP-dependent helicase HrpA